jgi:hypothetical protein
MIDLTSAVSNSVVHATLVESGWTPGYRFDPTGWADRLRAEDFSVHPAGICVLELLGGLTVVPPRSVKAVFGTGELKIDPLWAAEGESERIADRERIIGDRLCPVGEWLGEYIVLVGEEGRVYAETTFQVLELGDDINQALVRLIVADSAPTPIA